MKGEVAYVTQHFSDWETSIDNERKHKARAKGPLWLSKGSLGTRSVHAGPVAHRMATQNPKDSPPEYKDPFEGRCQNNRPHPPSPPHNTRPHRIFTSTTYVVTMCFSSLLPGFSIDDLTGLDNNGPCSNNLDGLNWDSTHSRVDARRFPAKDPDIGRAGFNVCITGQSAATTPAPVELPWRTFPFLPLFTTYSRRTTFTVPKRNFTRPQSPASTSVLGSSPLASPSPLSHLCASHSSRILSCSCRYSLYLITTKPSDHRFDSVGGQWEEVGGENSP